MARANETLGQLVGQVLGLQRHLPGHVERYGVWPMLVDDATQALSTLGNCLGHVGAHWRLVALLAQVGVFHAPGRRQRQVGGKALGAQPAVVAGVLLVAADLADLAVGNAHDDAATNAAIRAYAAHFVIDHGRAPVETQKGAGCPGLQQQAGATRRLCRENVRAVDVDGPGWEVASN